MAGYLSITFLGLGCLVLFWEVRSLRQQVGKLKASRNDLVKLALAARQDIQELQSRIHHLENKP